MFSKNEGTKVQLQNGVDLQIELSFGNSQSVIDKNLYFIGDGT